MKWYEARLIDMMAAFAVLAIVLFPAAPVWAADPPLRAAQVPAVQQSECFSWSGADRTGPTYSYTRCTPAVVVVTETKTVVQEVKVPTPVPVVVKEEKKIRE